MKRIFDGKLILYLMLFSPIIDILTSIMLLCGIDITIGIILKCLMLLLVCIYLVFYDREHCRQNLIFIFIIGIFNILNLVNNLSVIKNSLFSYFGYLVKYDFSILMILFFIRYFKKSKIDIRLLKIPIVIISISIVLSNITGTALYTYDMYRSGTSSWFSSGNEFGAILSILYPISIYLFLDRKDSKKIDIFYVLILAYGMINLGTKVGLFSFFISSVCYLIFRLFNIKKYKLNYSFYAILVLLILVGCLFEQLPTVKNIKSKYDYVIDNTEIENEEQQIEEITNQVILSNRNQYLSFIRKNSYNWNDYLLGKINFDGNRIVLIEMDLLDTFYMFGLVGFVLLYGLIGYIIIAILIKYLKNISNGLKYIKINMLLICLCLSFFISCLVGHVLFCPSVSIYFAVICSYLYVYDKFEKEESDKIKILIGAVHMKIGGIESTLINLLNNIDYSEYEVDLFLLLKNGDFYDKIPNNVKIITPYYNIFDRFFAEESKFSKVIKHILYNKYTAWLWTNNKRYDVAIDYTGYYLFTDYYIGLSDANKKLIWVHQNVYGSLKYDKNFNRNFIKNLNKYNLYNKIVCVSDSTKNDFDKMFENLSSKTCVVVNLQTKSDDIKEKVELEGDYKIISVGRICPQKGFSRLVEVHRKLLDNNYKINTYILGDGEEYDKLSNLIEENGLSDTFKLLGKKSNVFDYLKVADLFVSTSRYEALPTVLLESLMCNLPWVGPNVSGIVDVYKLSPKKSCILTDDSVDGIVKGIEEAINGEVNRNFKFNLESYNKKALKQFYKVIGD